MVQECWFESDINSVIVYTTGTTLNTVTSSEVTTSSNPMYNWGSVGSVGMFLASASTLSGGKFRLGVWDSAGDIKAVSAQFTVSDLAEGTTFGDTEEFLISLTHTTTITTGDCVGIIMNEAPTGMGDVIGGGWFPASLGGLWRRHIFVQGSIGSYSTTKICAVCLSTVFTPSVSDTFFPPPPAYIRL